MKNNIKIMDLNEQINVSDFVWFVDRMNSGYDRDCVFAYLENYLKEKKNIVVDLEEFLFDEDE